MQVAVAELLCGGHDTFLDREQRREQHGGVIAETEVRTRRLLHYGAYRKTMMSLTLKKRQSDRSLTPLI